MGADISGSIKRNSQAKYIAIVLGTKESINRIYQKIGLSEIHMSLINNSQKQKVFQNLIFNNNDLIGICLTVERQNTIDLILNNPKFNSRSISKLKLQKHFDYLLLKKIRNIIESFSIPRKYELKDIVMQCDPDMSKTGINWNMKTSHKGKAYEIADAVAWCNGHGKEIKFCKEIDISNTLQKEMKHDMLK